MAHFSFNKPEGACPRCTGLGTINSVNLSALLDENLSLPDGAVRIWTSSDIRWNCRTLANAARYFGFEFDANLSVKCYGKEARELLLYGIYSPRFRSWFPSVELPTNHDNGRFEGIVNIVKMLSDYVIDMGPEGGDNGGELIKAGTPEEIAATEDSITGQYLRKH